MSDREQGDEDRHSRVRDCRHARVDVLLAPGDERERDRAVDDPSAKPSQPSRRMSATVSLQPRCAASTTRSSDAASSSRSMIIVAGSKARSATLMNMYDAPQNAASSPM